MRIYVSSSIKSIVNKLVNTVLEEARKLFLEKLQNDAYQAEYLRDSNGYLKPNGKQWALKILNELVY